MKSDDGETQYGQLAGEGREKPGQLAQTAAPPCAVVDDVDAAVVGVDTGNDEEIDTHQEVAHG